MKRHVTITAAALAGLAILGAQAARADAPEAGGSQMMMGPMAGCPMGAGDRGMAGSAMMGGGRTVDAQLDALHAALGLRPYQEKAWPPYAKAARADADVRQAMHDRMRGFMSRNDSTAPDWLGAHREMMRARLDSLDKLQGASNILYAKLDSSQREIFNRFGGGVCGP